MNKYLRLRRSQIQIALLNVENELLATDGRGRCRVRSGSKRDSELRKNRAELLDALRVRDAEIIDQWKRSVLYRNRTDAR